MNLTVAQNYMIAVIAGYIALVFVGWITTKLVIKIPYSVLFCGAVLAGSVAAVFWFAAHAGGAGN